jgi:hypothetical protein
LFKVEEWWRREGEAKTGIGYSRFGSKILIELNAPEQQTQN